MQQTAFPVVFTPKTDIGVPNSIFIYDVILKNVSFFFGKRKQVTY